MADDREPPPLFDTVDINSKANDDDDEDLFVSTLSSVHHGSSQGQNLSNGSSESQAADVQFFQSVYKSAVAQQVAQEGEHHVKSQLQGTQSLNEIETENYDHFVEVTVTDPQKIGEVEHHMKGLLQSTQSLEEVETENYDNFLEITVTDPQKIGDGMGSYIAYRVTTKTNLPKFRRNQFSVMRRFSDFLGLHEKLVEKYLRSGRIIPPAPEKSVVGTTKVKISNQGEPGVQSEFIEKRRAALERFMVRTAAHPILSDDPDFREFLEADVELPRATNTSALSSAGVLRLFNKFGETVNKITFKMEENDPWFEEKAQQIDNLDIQLRKLHSSVECLVLHRRDLASLTSSFAKSAAMLSNCEEHTSLSRALSQLAEVEEKVENLHNEQANADFSILCELLKDYVALIGAIKDVFHERVKVYQNWQHAQLMLTKKRELKSKFELQERRDKSSQVATEVAEWSAKVERGQEEFDNISHMIKKEVERFEVNRVKDFKAIIIQYLETLMNQQQELVKYWDTFLPEARAIA